MTIPDITPSDWWFLDDYGAEECPKVGRLVGGVTASNIVSLTPNAFPVPQSHDTSYIYGHATNRVIQVTDTDVYAQSALHIWKSTDVGSSWTAVYTFTGIATNPTFYQMAKHGPYYFTNGDKEYLVGMSTTDFSIARYRGWRMDLSDNSMEWSDAYVDGGTGFGCRLGCLWHNNILYIDTSGTATDPAYFNPATMRVDEIAQTRTTGVNRSDDLTFFVGDDGKIYQMFPYNSRLSISPLEGGLLQHIGTADITIDDPDGANTNINAWHRNATFRDPKTDDTAFIFLSNAGSSTGPHGWSVARATAPYTGAISFATTVVIPNALSRFGTASSDPNKACHSVIDVNSNPTTPGIFLLFWEDTSGPVSVYQWKGFDTALRYVGDMSGATSNNCLPLFNIPTMQMVVGNGTDRGRVFKSSKSGIYTKIHYKLEGSGGSETVRFRWYDLRNNTNGVCTLVSGTASGTSSVSGSAVNGVTADGSEHSVDWNITADGLERGQPDIVILVEYESGV